VAHPSKSKSSRPLLGRALVFIAIFCMLQLGWQALGDTSIHRWVVDDATVGVAVAIVNHVTPTVRAQALGTRVHAVGGGLNIVNGCEGTETWFLLCAAFVVAPVPWRARFTGLALGTLVVFGVNQLRVLALFYANRNDAELFNLLHAVIGPIAVLLAVAGFFYGWITQHAAPPAESA
jgi:exosortase/archaeosortase family protein